MMKASRSSDITGVIIQAKIVNRYNGCRQRRKRPLVTNVSLPLVRFSDPFDDAYGQEPFSDLLKI